jgi:glycosyltransferase involved in cell wall biosynthesis
MTNPTISVIIPTYNHARYIAEALESVFAQTFKDYEVIVVDDGSTDNTQAVLQPYMERIRYVRKEHRGYGAARNRGISEARGEFVAFLDSDDLWEAAALETLLEAFQEKDVAIAASASRLIRKDGNPTDELDEKRSPGPYFTTHSLLFFDHCFTGHVYRKSCFASCGPFNESPLFITGADYDMWLRVSVRFRLRYIETPLLKKRVHDTNLTVDYLPILVRKVRVIEKFLKEHPQFTQKHPWVLQKMLSKRYERIGKYALLFHDGEDSYREARRHLRYALRHNPFRGKLYVLYGFSYCPGLYKRWKSLGFRA